LRRAGEIVSEHDWADSRLGCQLLRLMLVLTWLLFFESIGLEFGF